MSRQQRIEKIKKIESTRGSKVFCLLTSDRPNLNVQLQKDILPKFVNQLRGRTEYSKIDIFIFTLGGDTLAGFGLSKLLREYSNNIGILIPDKCHSAGTLIALGGNEIIMTKGATLSPIDPSIIRPLNPAIQVDPQQAPQLIPLSVESVAGYQALVQKEWKLTDKESVSDALSLLAEKVHPLALGDVFRARQQIELLAHKLLTQHRNDSRKINEIIRILSKSLGSHDYLIYRKEAQSILGNQVKIDLSLEDLIWDLYLDFVEDMKLGVPFDQNLHLAQAQPLPPQPLLQPHVRTVEIELVLAAIESSEKGDRAVQRLSLAETLIPQPNGQIARQTTRNMVFAGWENYN